MLGAGDLTFTARSYVLLDKNAVNLALGDLSGDAVPDVVALCSYTFRETVLQVNDGTGTLAPAATCYAGYSTADVDIRDVNRDGRPDLVFNGSSDGALWVLRHR